MESVNSKPGEGRTHRDVVAAHVSDSHVRPAGALLRGSAALSTSASALRPRGSFPLTPPASPGSLCAGLRWGGAGRANVCDGFWTFLHAASLFFNFIFIIYMLPKLSHRTWQSPSCENGKGCTVFRFSVNPNSHGESNSPPRFVHPSICELCPPRECRGDCM